VAAVDRGDEGTAERAHEEELEPIASALMFVAARSVEQETRTTAEHLRALRRVQSIGMATPAVFGVGLLLLGLFLRVLRGYQRGMERQARENEHQALHDMLTGLPNRTLLQQRTDAAIDSAADRGQQAALLLLDLDRFKEVNDTLGHHHGDLLLEQLAGRLRAAVRDGDTLARLGGDEFAVMLPGADQEHAEAVGARLLGALIEPMMLDGILVTVDGSIGIAVYPDHAENGEELLRRADVAMYAAKETHAGYVVYDSHFDKRDTRRLGLLGELRRALAERELVLHYQPKASLRSGEVDGVEALVRWQHPQQGLLGPGEFIPLAERTGLIEPLTHYVLGEALSQTRSWLDEGIELTVSVNVPTRCLLDLEFPAEVGRQLDRCEVPADRLVLEITEGTIMQDPERSMRVLQRLRAMGVRLSIDDFGTGYSSMAYLKSLPVHELKVDRSFISQMSTNRSDEMIVTSTIELAHNLGLQIVAEGVEDRATWDHLNLLGCDSVQGYYLAKPMPAGKVAEWLAGVAAPAPSGTPAP
jgi:diguanylate cyclase (GGDEF)-like protein